MNNFAVTVTKTVMVDKQAHGSEVDAGGKDGADAPCVLTATLRDVHGDDLDAKGLCGTTRAGQGAY